MSIQIQHPYRDHFEITFDDRFHCNFFGTIDTISEIVCDYMVQHNFSHAKITSTDSGRIFTIIDRE